MLFITIGIVGGLLFAGAEVFLTQYLDHRGRVQKAVATISVSIIVGISMAIVSWLASGILGI